MKGECDRWAEHLFEPESALGEPEKAALAAHLSRCPDCALERELFLESWSAFGDLEEEELEPCSLLRAKVWQKIREEQCLPKSFLTGLHETLSGWRRPLLKTAAAAAAILLGFGLGRSIRSDSQEIAAQAHPAGLSATVATEPLLDPDLIKLASQDGFSLNLFPESSHFSPIDEDMMTALSPTRDSRAWLGRGRGTIVPVEYLAPNAPPGGRGR